MGKSLSSIIDLQDASARRCGSRLRGMENGRCVEPYVPRFSETRHGAALLHDAIDVLDGDPTEGVRSGTSSRCARSVTILDNSSKGGAT